MLTGPACVVPTMTPRQDAVPSGLVPVSSPPASELLTSDMRSKPSSSWAANLTVWTAKALWDSQDP